MDFLAQQLIAARRWLANELGGLRRSIDALRDQIERQPQRQEAPQIAETPPCEVDATVHETEATQQENRSRHNRNLAVQILLTLGTWLAFIAAARYAGIARDQLDQMRIATQAAQSAADTAHETLIASQRAWMTAQIGLKGPLTFDANGAHIPIEYRLHNVGHSPAMMVWSDEEL